MESSTKQMFAHGFLLGRGLGYLLVVLLLWETSLIGAEEPKVSQTQIHQWIEDLGADTFAQREVAATKLSELGVAVLPQLHDAAEKADDPEARLRADQLAKHLTNGDLQVRIDAFLAGKEVDFEGWLQMQLILGDSNGVRKLFVELMTQHPEVTKSLAGSARERFIAMERSLVRVKKKRAALDDPNRADLVALLLPANDPGVPINLDYEGLILFLLRREVANRLHTDLQLSGPIDLLVSGMINRTSMENRSDFLFFSMGWGLGQVLPLAERTITDSTTPETLCLAIQMISRFGDLRDVDLVKSLLEDERVVSEQGFSKEDKIQTRVGDVAMAAIAMLNQVPLDKVGFTKARPHPTFSFMIEDVGFHVDAKNNSRNEVREKIRHLLKENASDNSSIAGESSDAS